MPTGTPRRLDGVFQPSARPIPLRPPITQTAACGIGIFTDCPSPAPFGFGLGPDLPWADEPSPGTLRLSAGLILTDLFATHTGILTRHPSSDGHPSPSPVWRRSPTIVPSHDPQLRYRTSAPLHFRCRPTRPVSYYALFEWWLLLSQHPGCLRAATPFPT